MFSLKGKVAVVTGAGSGIGAAIAEAFVDAGAIVVVSDLRADQAQEQVARLSGRNGQASSLKLDVSVEADCEAVAAEVEQRFGRVHILVNNAGIGHVGKLMQTTTADLERLWAVNVRGMFQVTRAFLPRMMAKGGGAIVNLASIAGIVAVRDRLAYTTTKFAVVGFTKAIALDHARDGIRCNCICPGRVETPFVSKMISQYPDPAQARAEMESTQAIGRMAEPREIAAAALYLASDEAGSTTGSAMIVDGGWTAGK